MSDLSVTLIFLGTASGLPTESRSMQTIVLKTGKDIHIIDPGDGASSSLVKEKLDHRWIRSIFVSHMHSDHHSGLIQILKTAMLLNKKSRMDVFMPGEGIVPVRRLVEGSYLPLEWLGFPIQLHSIEAQQGKSGPSWKHSVGSLNVTAYSNDHLKPFHSRSVCNTYPWKFQSYSFSMTVCDVKIMYSGNLLRRLEEISELISPGVILVTEIAHLDPDEVMNTVKKRQPKHAYITHFHPSLDMEALSKKVRAAGLEGLVTLASDRLAVTLQGVDC